MINFKKEDIFLITGGSSGIGKATALKLVELGASVVISGRNKERLEEVKQQACNPECVFIEEKELLKDIGSLPEWVKGIAKKYGKLKGLLPFAGVSNVRPLSLIDYESSVEVMNIHYFAPLMLIKGFADRRVNTGSNCSIVVMSSTSRYAGGRGSIEYASAKAAITASIRNIANELYHRNIRVNSVSPGFINTPLVEKSLKDGEINVKNSFNKMCGEPEYVANLVAFLVSDEARWINGDDIIIEGGTTLPNVFSKF
ncbi:MAG: SDR family oxidoreductase [Mucispirillum sp.]|nr:SDR family oxidoreductase [Mucispirillum sp.]